MILRIEPADPRDPQATALLQASHGLMQSLFAEADNHYLSIDALCAPDVHFFVAREGACTIGCGALVDKTEYGELKSMFVSEIARGKGVADALMRQTEDHARSLNLSVLKLETGNLLHSARKFYDRHGFSLCQPFGNYAATKTSIFMEKQL